MAMRKILTPTRFPHNNLNHSVGHGRHFKVRRTEIVDLLYANGTLIDGTAAGVHGVIMGIPYDMVRVCSWFSKQNNWSVRVESVESNGQGNEGERK